MVGISAETLAWAEEQWGTAALGDTRRTRRAVQVGAAMAEGVGRSLPQQMERWPALKGAYRLLARPEATHRALSTPHWQATRRAGAAAAGPVLFIHDTTQLDYTHHPTTRDLGSIGRGCHQRGFLVHTTLAVRPAAHPAAHPAPAPDEHAAALLGVADQRVWRRQGTGKRHQPRAERLARPKESDIWGDALESIGAPPPGACWVSVGDRESDVFDHLRRARALGWHCVVRARHNRALADGAAALLDRIRAQPAGAVRRVRLSARAGGRPRREHDLAVAWRAVHLPSPTHQPDGPGLAAWVVRAWTDTVEWILLSTLPVTSPAEANAVLDWYACRWLIEEYHKSLKTGCRIEQVGLRTADRLEAALGLLGIVAVRLLQLRVQARQTPDELARRIIDPLWLALVAGRLKVDGDRLTVRQFWQAVARLGGFLARKGDGDPGWQTLWLGFQRLQDMAWAAGYAPAARRCG